MKLVKILKFYTKITEQNDPKSKLLSGTFKVLFGLNNFL